MSTLAQQVPRWRPSTDFSFCGFLVPPGSTPQTEVLFLGRGLAQAEKNKPPLRAIH
jgi:hypothetical protein